MLRKLLRLVLALLAGTVFAFPALAARLPMYQMYSGQWADWFYTTSAQQRSEAINFYGYTDYGIAFYVDDGSTPGSTFFYRFYKGPPQTDHFYTHDSGEVSFVQSYGWAYEGFEGYVFPSQAAGTVRIYRMSWYNGANGDLMHFYTPDYSFASYLTTQGWSLDNTGFFAYTTPDPPPPTPRVVHATQLTAGCADKYCVKITGYNFASNAYIEMRSGHANGPIIWNEYSYTRGISGDATTLDVVLTNPGVRSTLDHADGIWFYVVNPGSPPGRGGGLNVIREHPYSLKASMFDFNATFTNGFACTDRDYSMPLTVTVRSGSDSGEIGYTGLADRGGSDPAQCGGNGSHVFGVQYPSRWKDGQTREIYVIANIDPAGNGSYRYPNGLVPGSPRLVAFPNTPWDAVLVSIPTAIITVNRGQFFGLAFTFQNRGNMNWGSGGADAVFLGQPNPVSWAPSSVGLQFQPVPPDGNAPFNFGVAAPSTPGTYQLRFQLRHGSTFFGSSIPVTVFVQ